MSFKRSRRKLLWLATLSIVMGLVMPCTPASWLGPLSLIFVAQGVFTLVVVRRLFERIYIHDEDDPAGDEYGGII